MNSKIIRELLRKYFWNILFLLAIAVLMVLISVLTIEIGRRIINLISSPISEAGRKQYDLIVYCLFFLSAILASGAIDYMLQIRYAKFSQSFVSDIRLKLFNHLLQLPQDFFNKNPIGQIVNRIMNEVGNIGSFFARLFLSPVINIIMIVFYGVYIFQLNWKLALAGTIFIPICVIIIPKFNRRIQALTEQSVECNGNLTGHFQEVFTGIGDIRSSQTYNFEESRLKKRIMEYFTINVNMAKTYDGLGSLIMIITQLAPLSLYLYGGYLCLRGEIAVGTLVAAIAVITNLYNPVNSVVNFVMEWRQVRIRFDKLDEYFMIEPEKGILTGDALRTISNGYIQLDKVQFGFDKEQILLNDINFVTQYGKKVAFVGTSGSGKSLAASIISTIYKPLSGKLCIGGQTFDSVPLYDLRSTIGYLNQTPFLFNDTIRHNILYALLRKNGEDSSKIEQWVDLSLIDGIHNMELLDHQIINIVKEVGLLDDVLSLGLRSKVNSDKGDITDGEKGKIISARKFLHKEIGNDDGKYIEIYREDQFLEYCTILENIVFCPTAAINDKFESVTKFYNNYLYEHLAEKGMMEDIFNIGLQLTLANNFLIEKLYKDKSPLLDYFELDKNQIESKVKINERLTMGGKFFPGLDKTDPELFENIMSQAFNYSPGRSKEELLNDKTRRSILDLRCIIMKSLSEKFGKEIEFYNPEAYMESLSIMENIIFGNINHLRKKASEDVTALVNKIVKDVRLEDLVINLGLEFKVGERGSKLSGGQRQKVAIARILLRNPSILILDEATAALDSASQSRVTELVKEKFRDKTVISIAHRLNIIKDYDIIFVFDKGRIVEEGTFEELMRMNGLFAKLYSGSN